jgi:hypothetical protein
MWNAGPPTCYAFRCEAEVEPEHPMCAAHWALVPPHIQELVRAQWHPGWRAALDAAILAVVRAEREQG